MLNAFREGGWGMYPTFVLGLVTLGAALRFAFRADPRLRGFVESMTRSVLFFGLLGFVTGMITTVNYLLQHHLTGSEFFCTLVEGAGEASNNLAAALLFVSLVHLVVAVGRRRIDAKAAG